MTKSFAISDSLQEEAPLALQIVSVGVDGL